MTSNQHSYFLESDRPGLKGWDREGQIPKDICTSQKIPVGGVVDARVSQKESIHSWHNEMINS